MINARQFTFQKYTDNPEPLPANLLEVQPDGKYRMVKHPNWGMQQPSKPTFHGKVLILINGGSFSTTSEFLSHAHFHKRATFIGEESGGGYYGNTSGPSLRLTLPHLERPIGRAADDLLHGSPAATKQSRMEFSPIVPSNTPSRNY